MGLVLARRGCSGHGRDEIVGSIKAHGRGVCGLAGGKRGMIVALVLSVEQPGIVRYRGCMACMWVALRGYVGPYCGAV